MPPLIGKFSKGCRKTSVLFTDVNDKIILIGLMLIFYVVLNFIITGVITEGGRVTEDMGKYIFSRGDFERISSEAEYNKFKAASTRLFSSAWLLVGFGSYVYLSIYKRKARKVPRLVIKHHKLLKRTQKAWFALLRR